MGRLQLNPVLQISSILQPRGQRWMRMPAKPRGLCATWGQACVRFQVCHSQSRL